MHHDFKTTFFLWILTGGRGAGGGLWQRSFVEVRGVQVSE
jgi:hypothetical protein